MALQRVFHFSAHHGAPERGGRDGASRLPPPPVPKRLRGTVPGRPTQPPFCLLQPRFPSSYLLCPIPPLTPVPAPWTLRRGEDSWARSLPPLPGSARDGRGGGAGLETNQPDGAPDNPAERSQPTQVRSTSPRGAEQAALPGPPLSLASPSAVWTLADRGRAPSPRAARRAGAPGAQQGAPARTRAARRAARGGGGGGGGAGGGRGAGTSGRR